MEQVDFLTSQYQAKNFDQYFQQDRLEMLNYIPETAKYILDVGCSSGGFGQLLKEKYSSEVWGIEPNHAATESTSTKLDKVICSMFDSSVSLPEYYFDCIVFNDVLEHLVDPTALPFITKYNNSIW